MAICNRLSFLKNLRISYLNFSTSCSVSSRWRRRLGLEDSPYEFSPLTQLPDYSFVDGRPVPLSLTKLRKIQYQQKLCERIVQLNYELDVGLELHKEKKKQEELDRETRIRNKLIAKGAALLKNNKNQSKN